MSDSSKIISCPAHAESFLNDRAAIVTSGPFRSCVAAIPLTRLWRPGCLLVT